MSKSLPGESYCVKHQGDHSHYAEHNCTVCRLTKLVTEQQEQLKELQERIRLAAGAFDGIM